MIKYQLNDVMTPEYRESINTRFRETVKRVKIIEPSLDIGEPNSISKYLEIKKNTNFDLNWEWPVSEKFRTITCFEVIEHVENPLMLMKEIYDHLEPGGKLYLTTPVRWWIGKGKHHFHEFSIGELTAMLHKVGFLIYTHERIRAYQFNGHFGIRPIVRWLRDIFIGQCVFVEAEKTV